MNITISKNSFINQNGFTMIEIIVVIVLAGIMFNFFIPRIVKPDNMITISRRFIAMAGYLRTMAVRDQTTQSISFSKEGFFPEFSSPTKGDDSDDEDDVKLLSKDDKKSLKIKLPDHIELIGVEFANGDIETQGKINFYKSSYADNVAIHLENKNEDEVTLIVEPFLSTVRLYREYIELKK